MLSVAVGSEGGGEERYSVRLLFEIPPTYLIDDAPYEFEIGGRNAKLVSTDGYFVLTVSEFPSRSEAEDFEKKLRAAFLALAMKRRMGFAVAESGQVDIFDNPKPIAEDSPISPIFAKHGWAQFDGQYDEGRTVVVAEHLRLVRWGAGKARVTLSQSAEKFGGDLREVLAAKSLEGIRASSKLQLAIEIYSSSFFEVGQRARFIRQISVLESLVKSVRANALSSQVLDDLRGEVNQRRDSFHQDTAEYQELDRLANRVGNLKRESIRRSMREMVEATSSAEEADQVEGYYNLRSRLLHDGVADPQQIRQAVAFLNEFLPRFLLELAAEGS